MNDEEFKKLFAKNLNYFMNLNDKSQADLARYLGCGSGLASTWCNGVKAPRMDTIQSIANWFNIELSDLLDDKSKKQEDGYYLNDEMRKIAHIICENPDMKEIVELSLNLSPKKRRACINLIKQFMEK